jgi:lipopolysaccharide/colanic/teichoic acid biosynthesis glycosyltransferase
VSEASAEVIYQEPISATVSEDSSRDWASTAAGEANGRMPVHSWRYRYVKRLIDYVGALILLAVFAIPGLLIAAAIVLTSPGPVFYREDRVGRGGALFRIWKFRSMRRDASRQRWTWESARGGRRVEWRMRKDLKDPRVTPVGRFLRRWSLDEVPQLFNILAGEMSLVGPRPIVESEMTYYGDRLSLYLAANPGLSGLWQVSGRSMVGYEERAELDARYVQSWTLAADLRISLRTVHAVISRVGAN